VRVGARRYVIKFSGMDITLGLAAAKANQGCVQWVWLGWVGGSAGGEGAVCMRMRSCTDVGVGVGVCAGF
jgi:hypothetical protein